MYAYIFHYYNVIEERLFFNVDWRGLQTQKDKGKFVSFAIRFDFYWDYGGTKQNQTEKEKKYVYI